jgi:protein-S-isoprenylcysteine O-methyltransferase Ste14
MEWAPALRLGWLNGWLVLAGVYLVFGVQMLLFPRAVVARLYDRSGWTRSQRRFNRLAKLVAFGFLYVLIGSPLKIGEPVLWVGLAVVVLGLAILVIALIDYRNTPLDEPVTGGLYRFSRNPQWVGLAIVYLGLSLAIGSWLAVVSLVVVSFLYHFRILAEEGACAAQYGQPYRSYLQRVPRYLLF